MRRDWLFLLAILAAAALWPLPQEPAAEPPRDPHQALRLALRAGDLCASGQKEEALALCEEALSLDDRCAPAWNNRGWIRYLRGDAVGALADAERSLALQPGDDCTLHTRAMALIALDRFEEARRDLYRAIEANPREALYYTDLATLCMRLGEVAEAERVIRLRDKAFSRSGRACGSPAS